LRAPVDTIAAPPFLAHLKWVNVASLRMDKQLGQPVLIEFWDFCRPNSLHTLPYLKAWHERYEADGLRVVGIHSPGFEPARDPQAVKDAVARLGIEYPVLLDSDMEMWQEYGNQGWPARYLFDRNSMLSHYHYGEGAYTETELAIQELLGIEREPVGMVRPEDAIEAELAPQTQDQPGPYSGPYEAGGVWAVLDGTGTVRVSGVAPRGATHTAGTALSSAAASVTEFTANVTELTANVTELTVSHPGAYLLIEHPRHTAGVLELELGPGVRCHATCFTPGLAPTAHATG
jgi:thiol-disulfide isomerase/thioredoxin